LIHNARTADFFLTFDQKLNIQRDIILTVLIYDLANRMNLNNQLTFVICGSPGIDTAFSDARFKRGRSPLAGSSCRLDVVVAVD
jgi:hypothetical protein